MFTSSPWSVVIYYIAYSSIRAASRPSAPATPAVVAMPVIRPAPPSFPLFPLVPFDAGNEVWLVNKEGSHTLPFCESAIRTLGKPFSILITRSPPELVVKELQEIASITAELGVQLVWATGIVMSGEVDPDPRLESKEMRGPLATSSSLAVIPVRFIRVV